MELVNDDPDKGAFKEPTSKPLDDVTFIINRVLIPLEAKEGFKKQLAKFSDNVYSSVSQVDNNVGLQIISLPKDMSDEALGRDSQIMKRLDKLADEWSEALKAATDKLTNYRKDIKSASLEIDNRRSALSTWSNLAQQLKSEAHRRIYNIIINSEESNRKQLLKSSVQTFEKTFDDATDYLKFLTTLERSIKDLGSEDLSTIEHSISGIFHNLKIIYMISKHKDYDKFGFLMETMAREIQERISDKIKLKEIFKTNPEQIDQSISLIDQAMSVVSKWLKCYNETRNKTKWEFHSGKITGPTEYIGKICGELKKGLNRIKDFLKFLGPELKRVIGGGSEMIEKQREKVFKAYSYIENYPHPIFDKSHETSCNSVFDLFKRDMDSLELDTIQLIHETFKELRSAESAFDLYTNFENLINQPNIKKAMREKYINILQQFIKEIKQYSDIFERYKDNPPISKAKSEVAGKIAWARLLYLKMKRPISKIFTDKSRVIGMNSTSNKDKDHDHEIESQEKDKWEKELRDAFLDIAKRLRLYENTIYENWKNECVYNFMKFLRNNILIKKGKSYEVNFDIGLKLMIRNTKFLDLYGYNDIPKNIINIAHQEAQLARHCNMLNLMLREYDSLLDSLNQQHHDLLKTDIERLISTIEVGCVGTTSHNWTSLGIEEFIKECSAEIKVLKDKANSVFKSEEKIKNILKQISNANFVRDMDTRKVANKQLMQFFTYYEEHRRKIINDLLNKYDDITGILVEIEKSTFEQNKDENTLIIALQNKNSDNNKMIKPKASELGERAEMGSYYRYWEICILNALTKSILKAVITIYQLFSISRQENNQNFLFTIKSKFISSKEIMYNPNDDIDLILKKFVLNFGKSGNEFIRWLNGSCKTPDTKDLIEEKFEQIAQHYSYGTEIENNKDIRSFINSLFGIIQKLGEVLKENVVKYIKRAYQNPHFGNWGQTVTTIVEKELQKNKTSLKIFEKKLAESEDYLEKFKKDFHPRRPCDGNCEINNEELINKGIEQIRKVMNDMLKILASQLEDDDMKKIGDIIQLNKNKLNEKITDSESLKKVLDYISKIQNKKLSMELKMKDIEEKLHFLKLHNYPNLKELQNKFETYKKEWDNLRVKAKKKDDKLLTKKKNLADETKKDVMLLKEEVGVIYKQYILSGPATDKVDLGQGIALLREYNEKLEVLKSRKENIVVCQKLFNLEITTFPEINEMIDTNAKIEPIYKYYKEFNDFYEEQIYRAWGKIEINLMDKRADEFNDKMRYFNRTLQLGVFPPCKKLEEIKDKYTELLQDIIKPLKSPIIHERNMKEFMKELRKSININFNITTLKNIIDLDLLKDKEKIQNLVNDASKENDIKSKLVEIEKVLDSMNFQIKAYKRGTEDKGYIFKDVKEEMDSLQENITNLQQFSNNKHAGAFKQQITELEQEMNLIMEIIEIWVEVQKKWMYLESIFVGSEDIRQKLPEEAKEFDEYDKKFRNLMTGVHKKPSIRLQCKERDRKFELKGKILVKFEQAEKKLTEHLDSKKNEFSRFYFLTDFDLLQILGSNDPLATLNPHMIKMYENCKELLSDRRNIIGMRSQEGEILTFERPIRVESQQQVGLWMNKVDEEMKSSLRNLTREGIQDYTKEELHKFIKNKLGMVVVNTIECWWTFALEDVFRRVKEGDKYAMKKELERQSTNLLELVKCVRRPDLTLQDRLKVNNLIIRVVHGREIVDKFVRDSILDAREFEWESQLKFTWDRKKDDMIIRQCNGEFYSCYEYQGLQGRLVVTPLTDRCVMTLTTALTFYLGGAPAGPAGTGKTETVKDLGKGLGIRVIVQNCTDTLDYLFMGQFFSGLSQTGFWGCFDEFNRINPEVLSVVTTQIKAIQNSLAQGKESWILLTKDVKLLPTIGIYITMNPNYEGRSELPDNLKALFRPVTMVTPDQLLICENLLLSEGFHDSRKLACKIDKLYQLCKEQLSKQHHYEWGLRSIKAVLSSAGILKRDSSEMPEDLILMKAMKDINMPKFIKDDAILFEGLIKDLFPTLDTSQEGKEDFRNLVIDTMKSLKYEIIEGQVTKIMQMFEVMNIRHTTMICGPPTAGKSVILEILKRTLEELKKTTVVTYLINPKAQTIPRLYGKKNEMTGDFEIGILANIFSIANQPLPQNKSEIRWVILDGDVDPIWIENMNSVMDDSKQLTLENKDRILMQKYCSLLLESYNIHHATLATISRLGMIYVDSSILRLDAIFYRWLEFKPIQDWDETIRENLKDLFKRLVPPCIKYVLKGARGNEEEGVPLKLIIKQYGASMVRQLCTLLDSMIPKTNPPTEITQLEQLFVFCVIWSIGSCLVSEDREKLTKFIKDIPGGSTHLPSSLYDKFWNMNMVKFEDWDSDRLSIIPEETGIGKKFNDIIIPTMDTKRYSWLLGQLISIKMPCLFVGEPGTGKTVTIQNYLKFLTGNQKSYLILNMNFSSRTSALDFQLNLEDIVENRMMRTMGPPNGKELIVFIDDLGMPRVDKYETQEPLAFLKLLIEKKCYYTKDNKDLIKLIDTNFIGSTLPPGGGNNQIDPRFIALFSVFNITAEQNAVTKIYDIILNNYLNTYPQDSEILKLKETIILATSELFLKIKESLPRTPIKFHYVFNIRDISKVFQGFCQLTPGKFQNKESLIKLWRHECIRVFADKLLSLTDKNIVNKIIEDNINRNFADQAEYALSEPCLHGDFLSVNFYEEDEHDPTKKKVNPRYYENLPDYEAVKTFLESSLEAYKDYGNQPMDLVFYNDCIDHLLRIHRIIRIERGNALLIGVGGSGKQSLAKLATFIARYDLWTIKITSRFEEKHFREQLVELFKRFDELGEVTPVTFLFTDEQVLDEGFMELINNILTTGIVPAIFEKGDKDSIIEKWKSEAGRLLLQETKDIAYGLYVNKIRENLHMIIAMSPSGDKLRTRCRNFPGLISNTTIDWFFEWPKEALLSVGNYLFSNYKLVEEDVRPSLIEHMVEVHLSLREFSNEALQSQKRYIYTTPKNFLDYIKAFKNNYHHYTDNVSSQINRLEKGLDVLSDASTNIEILKKQVEEDEAKVTLFLAELEILKKDLDIKTAATKESTEDARAKESFLKGRAIEIEQEKESIEQNLIEVKIIIESVIQTVSKIQPNDIFQMSKVQNFQGDQGTILKALYFSVKNTPVKWDNINDSDVSLQLAKTSLYTKMKDVEKTYFEINSVEQTNVAAKKVEGIKVKAGNLVLQLIQNWVINFNLFCKKNSEKLESETNLQRKLFEKDEAEKGLQETMAKLTVLNEQMTRLQIEQAQKDKEYKETYEKVTKLRDTLFAATELFEGLKSENSRWTNDKATLQVNKEKLIGDCLLGSAFLSYCGPFSFEFRRRMIYDTWRKDIVDKNINLNENFVVQGLLANEQTISQWNLEGLPDDELSVQNGILTENATRWPLCIDPEMQAISWIKKKKTGGLRVITFNIDNYMKYVIGAIKNGGTILIENVTENIDPNINPVLEKNYKVKAGITKITLDGTEIDVDSNFRLYMTTKLSNPHYTPEIMAKTVVINYSVTMDGLEEQLLNEVVRYEYPSLEETRRKLVDEMNTSKITLKNCEDNLLNALNQSAGSNILENRELIDTLKRTKLKAIEVKISLDNSETTKQDIYRQRDNYKPVAKRGSILYFAMSAMRLISSMYEYSLNAFMQVYRNSLIEAKQDTILNNRLENIKKKLTQLVYEYTCLSIFERHKLMFSFHMRTMIMKYEEKDFNLIELLFFLRGNLLDAKTEKKIDWLPDMSWQDLDGLSHLQGSAECFKNIMKDVIEAQDEWRVWYDLEKPEDSHLPQDYDKKLTLMQKLLVIRVFRKDRIFNAIKNFIRTTTGTDYFINAPAINLEKIHNQSNEKTPILFILSPGVDPMSYVTQLAIKKGFLEKKFRYMSLGQKQEREATEMIHDGVKRGLWILLQNCDLLKNWLKDLENIIDNIDKPKQDFRLWLTTSPIQEFPIGILQKSFKVVTEPPDGLPLNMQRVYNTINEEAFENESSHFAYKPLVYVLSFFHSVLQDRKKFGKIGWNVIYDFNESDFTISKRLLAMYLNKIGPDDAIPWSSLKYLIGEAMYGGRVTDDFDRRLMMTYLNEYMGDFIFDQNQKFFFSKIGFEFTIPETAPHDYYLKCLTEMPNIYSPEVIGLHSNAEIDYFTQASKNIWANLLTLQETTGSAKKKEEGKDEAPAMTREQFVLERAQSLLGQKLPDKFDILAVNRKFPNKSPIEAVLVQEIERYNVLNEKMRTSLSDLIKSLNGEISMNSEIEEIMISLFNGAIPIQWRKLAPETQKSLGNWIDHYQKRYYQYENWLVNGEPKVMWLSGLHIPASYLKAIIQTTSRKKGWALDKVDTYTVVTKFFSQDEIKDKPEYGCFIEGLYLEGAEWNVEGNHLERQTPKKLLCEMPLIQVIPAEASKIKLRNNLKTPVYMTQGRRNVRGEGLVFEADLRTLEHPNTWILQGVALILNTYYG